MCIESLSGTVVVGRLCAMPLMCAHCNDEWLFSLLVLWCLSGALHRGRQSGGVGRQPKGANRGDLQLPVVTLCQSSCPSEGMREP